MYGFSLAVGSTPPPTVGKDREEAEILPIHASSSSDEDESDHEAGPHPPQKQSKKEKSKKARIPQYIFTDAQEVDLAEWWRSNEFLYSKKLKAYKHTRDKFTCIAEKAASLEPTCTCKSWNYIYNGNNFTADLTFLFI